CSHLQVRQREASNVSIQCRLHILFSDRNERQQFAVKADLDRPPMRMRCKKAVRKCGDKIRNNFGDLLHHAASAMTGSGFCALSQRRTAAVICFGGCTLQRPRSSLSTADVSRRTSDNVANRSSSRRTE